MPLFERALMYLFWMGVSLLGLATIGAIYQALTYKPKKGWKYPHVHTGKQD